MEIRRMTGEGGATPCARGAGKVSAAARKVLVRFGTRSGHVLFSANRMQKAARRPKLKTEEETE